MNRHPLRNILVVRTDRIGDVVLTLPLVAALKHQFTDAVVTMLVRAYTRDLVAGAAEALNYDGPSGPKPFWSMVNEIRQKRFDAAFVAYPRLRVAALLWCARVPVRIGSGYRWYSFLFSRRVYEHRKTSEKHEAEYNLSLLAAVGCPVPLNPRPEIVLNESDRVAAREHRRVLALKSGARVAVLHPGSGGSARDWKPERFAELAKVLTAHGVAVVVSGGPGEDALVEIVASGAGPGIVRLVHRGSLREFGAFLESVDVFVSNSTGPMHIAASVGTPVVAFFPPLRAASPRRWGPLTEHRTVLVPDAAACPLCRGRDCRGNVCMDQITVKTAEEAVLRALQQHSGKVLVPDA